MEYDVLTLVAPQSFRQVGGFLGQRFHANLEARLKDWMLSEQFIRLHEAKRSDDWFWMGEQIGKWLDASAYAACIANDQALLNRVHEVLDRLARCQEPDGYLGITARHHRNPVRGMELYEMYYMLHGLLACHELLESTVALDVATRLGAYIVTTWGTEPGQFPLAGRFPGNGHDGGEGTLILEPIVQLGIQTGDARYVEWGERTVRMWDAWHARYLEACHTTGYSMMRAFAEGSRQVDELRENIHAHTFHMTLLGLAALYNATGEDEYREVVLGCVDRLAEEWILLTGGMSSGERYVPRRYYHPQNDVEVCPQHTWLLLLLQSLRWTGEARYAAEIERDVFNHFLAAQLGDGSNWSYMTPLNGRAQEPSGPNCCNAAGHRILGRLPTFMYGLREHDPAILLYGQSEVVLHPTALAPVTIRQETDFPLSGSVRVQVDPEVPARFALHLRIPPYAVGTMMRVNHERAVKAQPGGFVTVERLWSPGDFVQLSFPMRVTCQAGPHMLALVRGPLVYACFQDAQADPVVYHGRRGQYPEDLVLQIDPQRLDRVEEALAPHGLLGPALLVPARVEGRAPIFASSQANAELPQPDQTRAVLLPFVNQGMVRGEYRVFMRYA